MPPPIPSKQYKFGRMLFGLRDGWLTLVVGASLGTLVFVALRPISPAFGQVVAAIVFIGSFLFVIYRRVVHTVWSCPSCMSDVNPQAQVCAHCSYNFM